MVVLHIVAVTHGILHGLIQKILELLIGNVLINDGVGAIVGTHVHGVIVRRHGVYAVNGVDLSIKMGETMGLVGETGAGKSTIALSTMGLLPDRVGFITAGTITFDGKQLQSASSAEMRAIRGNDISMIFSDPMSALNPIHTVGKQIGEVIHLHDPNLNQKEVDEKVNEMLEMVGIPAERRNEYPHQFSGGMRQRIVIAIALACKPRLILADEPTTALDVTIQAQVLNMMNSLKKELNTSMLLITHDLGVVAQMCNSAAIMYAGEIIEVGSAEDIFESDKHHPYTVGLFGSIPDLKSKAKRLKPIDGLMPDPSRLPEGCHFADRCSHCSERCLKEAPPLYDFGSHKIKCFLFADGAQQKEDE